MGSILYYPHIEISNQAWLKSALLLWDNVYRIVPTAYRPKDSDEVRRACDHDLVRAVILEPKDIQGITNDFQNFLGGLEDRPAGLEYDELAYLHPEKINHILYPMLERYSVGESDDGFLQLPREVVRGYMFFLSSEIARRRQLSRCTDDEYSFAISSYFSESANFDDFQFNEEARGFYSSLIFQDILPFDIENVPMKKIIKASEVSKDERTQFKVELEKFSDQLFKCESIDHADLILNDYKKSLESAKENLRASQGFLNKNDVGSFVSVGVPAAAGIYSLLAAGAGAFGVYSLWPSVLIGAIAAYADYKKVPQKNPNGVAYLISLEKRFAGTGQFPDFKNHMKEFIND